MNWKEFIKVFILSINLTFFLSLVIYFVSGSRVPFQKELIEIFKSVWYLIFLIVYGAYFFKKVLKFSFKEFIIKPFAVVGIVLVSLIAGPLIAGILVKIFTFLPQRPTTTSNIVVVYVIMGGAAIAVAYSLVKLLDKWIPERKIKVEKHLSIAIILNIIYPGFGAMYLGTLKPIVVGLALIFGFWILSFLTSIYLGYVIFMFLSIIISILFFKIIKSGLK